MNRKLALIIGVAAIVIVLVVAWVASGAFAPKMTLASPAFSEGGMIPQKYTCKGENVTPPLSIRNVPENTRSLVLFVYDMDEPRQGLVNWVVYNMDPNVKDLPEGKLPVGSIEGLNGDGSNAYLSPCPEKGVHRYLFSLYAMSTSYQFTNLPTQDDLKKLMKFEVLAKAEMIGKYGNP